MIVVTRKALREPDGFIVWNWSKWRTPFFAKMMGKTVNRRAKLLLKLPFGAGLFWSYGTPWTE